MSASLAAILSWCVRGRMRPMAASWWPGWRTSRRMSPPPPSSDSFARPTGCGCNPRTRATNRSTAPRPSSRVRWWPSCAFFASHLITAYFHHPDEVALEFERAGIPLEALIGVEGPAWLFRDLEDHLGDAESRKRLLRAAEIVERDPATIAFSAHLLAVGRSRGPKTIELREQ